MSPVCLFFYPYILQNDKIVSQISHDELKYIKEAYDTNWMSTVGENIDEIEKEIAGKIGMKYAIALSSGTAALHLAVRMAGEKLYGKPKDGGSSLSGRKVFCSDLTFAATVNPVVYEGGEPVFIDTEYDTWNMCPESLKKAYETGRRIGQDVDRKRRILLELRHFPLECQYHHESIQRCYA